MYAAHKQKIGTSQCLEKLLFAFTSPRRPCQALCDNQHGSSSKKVLPRFTTSYNVTIRNNSSSWHLALKFLVPCLRFPTKSVTVVTQPADIDRQHRDALFFVRRCRTSNDQGFDSGAHKLAVAMTALLKKMEDA